MGLGELLMVLARHLNSAHMYLRAKVLRRDAPKAERVLWFKLREQRPAHGLKFRRQYPVGGYIVDFACLECGVMIELDGMSHDATLEQDRRRNAKLRCLGYRVLRFGNQEVYENVDGVVASIVEVCLALRQLPLTKNV